MSSSQYLVEEKEYEFLRRLGIEKTNYGVFSKDGWSGSGEVRSKGHFETTVKALLPFKRPLNQ